jgi:hypothetical protein
VTDLRAYLEEKLRAHEPARGDTQWYVDQHCVDCDHDELLDVVVSAVGDHLALSGGREAAVADAYYLLLADSEGRPQVVRQRARTDSTVPAWHRFDAWSRCWIPFDAWSVTPILVPVAEPVDPTGRRLG